MHVHFELSKLLHNDILCIKNFTWSFA